MTESSERRKMYVCRIVVGNLDERCTKSDLEVAFRPFGDISVLNYINVNQALLNYSCPDAAGLAIQRMNLVTLCGCCLSVSIFTLYLKNGLLRYVCITPNKCNPILMIFGGKKIVI